MCQEEFVFRDYEVVYVPVTVALISSLPGSMGVPVPPLVSIEATRNGPGAPFMVSSVMERGEMDVGIPNVLATAWALLNESTTAIESA